MIETTGLPSPTTSAWRPEKEQKLLWKLWGLGSRTSFFLSFRFARFLLLLCYLLYTKSLSFFSPPPLIRRATARFLCLLVRKGSRMERVHNLSVPRSFSLHRLGSGCERNNFFFYFFRSGSIQHLARLVTFVLTKPCSAWWVLEWTDWMRERKKNRSHLTVREPLEMSKLVCTSASLACLTCLSKIASFEKQGDRETKEPSPGLGHGLAEWRGMEWHNIREASLFQGRARQAFKKKRRVVTGLRMETEPHQIK